MKIRFVVCFISVVSLLLTRCDAKFFGIRLDQHNVTKLIFGTQMDEKMVDVDGETVYFQMSERGKPPILLLHGYGGSSNGFAQIYNRLSKQFTVVAVDILGFGNSSKPLQFQYSYVNQATIYDSIMKQLGYSHFDVLGHSMGGEIALNMTYLFPNDVSHLILVDASGSSSLSPKESSMPPLTYSPHISKISQFVASAVKDSKGAPTLLSEINKQDTRRITIPYPSIHTPVLIVWGDQDRTVPLSEGEKFHTLLPINEFHLIHDGNHAPFRAHANEFMSFVDSFLKSHPVSPIALY